MLIDTNFYFCATRVKEKMKKPLFQRLFKLARDPAGIRTQDPYIKSVMLYQLSYEILTLFSISLTPW